VWGFTFLPARTSRRALLDENFGDFFMVNTSVSSLIIINNNGSSNDDVFRAVFTAKPFQNSTGSFVGCRRVAGNIWTSAANLVQ